MLLEKDMLLSPILLAQDTTLTYKEWGIWKKVSEGGEEIMKLISRVAAGAGTLLVAANLFAGSAFAGYSHYTYIKPTTTYKCCEYTKCYNPCEYNNCKPVRPGWGFGDSNHFHSGPPGLYQ